LDARAKKTAIIVHRKQILYHMTKKNHRLEMERLRGMIESKAIKKIDYNMLKNRIEQVGRITNP
jgi:hypothetical protein